MPVSRRNEAGERLGGEPGPRCNRMRMPPFLITGEGIVDRCLRAGTTNSQYSAVILMVHCNRPRLRGVRPEPAGTDTIRREGNEKPLRVLPRQVRLGAAPPRVQEFLLPQMRRSLQGLVAYRSRQAQGLVGLSLVGHS